MNGKGKIEMQIINRKRLIADEGKILTDGKDTAYVVDCSEEDVSKWTEIDYIPPEEDDASEEQETP